MTPIFSSTSWALTVWYSFLHWKIAEIHFHVVLLSSVMVCKIPEFWRCKLLGQKFFLFDSGIIHIKESKKPGFTFSHELRTKIVWSQVLLLLVAECYLHRVEAKVFKFGAHFSQNAAFIGCNIFSLLLVIFLSWNLHLKLSHELLTFISFHIWR